MIRHAIGLNIGKVISRSFATWGRNFLSFTLLALVIQSPLIAFALAGPVSRPWHVVLFAVVTAIMPMVASFVTAGAVAFGVLKQLRGEPATLWESVVVGLKRLVRVLGVALVVAGTVTVMMIATAFFAYQVFFGFWLLAIFVAMILCAWAVAVPAAVVEGTGVGGSLRRSMHLTKEARIPVFGILLVFGLISFGSGLIVDFAVPDPEPPRISPPQYRSDPGRDEEYNYARFKEEYEEYYEAILVESVKAYRFKSVVRLVVGAVLSCLSAVASVIVYYDLRVQKEQVHLDKIVEVFT
jgi:hypothetical protein